MIDEVAALLAGYFEVTAEETDPRIRLDQSGFDSVAVLEMVEVLEEWSGGTILELMSPSMTLGEIYHLAIAARLRQADDSGEGGQDRAGAQ